MKHSHIPKIHRSFRLIIFPLAVFWILGCSTTLHDVRKWESTEDVPRLIRTLRDANYRTSDAAISALARIGEPAIQPLIDQWERNYHRTHRTIRTGVILTSIKTGRQNANIALALGFIGEKAIKVVPAMISWFLHLSLPLDATQLVDPKEQRIFMTQSTVHSTYSPSIAGVPLQPETHSYTISEFAVWAWAAKQITGEDFGIDRKLWKEWWQKKTGKKMLP